jgi:N-acetylglucosaminyldiphosphoundecaprenol N-acetyl-beta-D-mannosaminyltransferase
MIPNKYRINDIYISDVSYENIIDSVRESISKKRRIIITYVNHYIYNLCRDNIILKDIINESVITHPDGIGIWFAGKLLGIRHAKRFNWTDHSKKFLDYAAEKKWRIFFLGSDIEALEKIINMLSVSHPGLEIAGVHDGYSELNEKSLIELINNSNADILWVGMGSPKQEEWIYNYHEKLNVSMIQAVGGVFEYLAENRIRGPIFLQKLGFEWLFRLMTEPKRLWKRYALGIPLFFYRIIMLKLSSIFKIKSINERQIS